MMRRAFASPRAALRAAAIFALLASAVNLSAQTSPPAPADGKPADAGQIDVPVREVVLFSSGVGFFQHQGAVKDNASAELRFKTKQINDILKSLVLQDLDGGKVGAVTYPSQDPLEKTLASFQVDISDNPSLGGLLNKLRGARIAISYAGDTAGMENLSGTILGVEDREVPGGKEDKPVTKSFLNLITDKGIRSLELTKVGRIQLEDAGLQEELNKALAALAGARDQDKKPVVIHFDGQGERRVRLGYVVETPIWKASYRLVLTGDDSDKAAKPQAILQGWAIVENQTDNDWNNVKLSLVSGRPISFIQDLYQPLYVPRPTVVPELYASLRPQEYDAGQAGEDNKPAAMAMDTTGVGAALPASPAMAGRAAKMRTLPSFIGSTASASGGGSYVPTAEGEGALPVSTYGEPLNATSSVAAISDAAKVGELFQYTVGSVTLPRQRSAMIPIINDLINVEKLSIFNQGVLGNHPLNGLRFRNDSADKKHLLAGPVTVFDEGRYAGDARLDNVTPGQERLLSYGIDLQVLVVVKDLASKEAVQGGKIVKGVLQVMRKYVSAKEYSAENKADHDKKLVVEHPLRPGWKLADALKPVETTEALYRFEQAVGAGKTEKLTVREENIQRQQFMLMPMNLNDVLTYSRTGEISQPVRDALAKAAALKRAANDTQNQIADREGQVRAIGEEQNRIRENLKATKQGASDYNTRLMKKLNDQETQLDKLRGETDDLRTKLDAQTRELADYLANLNVE